MNYLATTTRRLVRPNTMNAMRMANRPYMASGGSAEGMKLRRVNSQGQPLPVRDGEIGDDGRAMLEKAIQRPGTGDVDHCTDAECKWFCKQNKLTHYAPYPVETYQAVELCPNSWTRAGALYNTLYVLLAVPGFMGLFTDYRAEHARYALDGIIFKAFRDKETDDHRDLKKCRGWGGFYDIMKNTERGQVPSFAAGGSGICFVQQPYAGIGKPNEDLMKMGRFKYVKVA